MEDYVWKVKLEGIVSAEGASALTTYMYVFFISVYLVTCANFLTV